MPESSAESAPGEELSASEVADEESVYAPPKLTENMRAPLNRPHEWLFLVENRLLLTGVFLLGVFALLLTVELATSFIRQGISPLFYVFGALIGGNFTLITIVVSISQLVISQQLGSPGDLRQRIEQTNQYREAVEEGIDRDVAPVTPTDFLQILLEQTATTLESVSDELETVPESEPHDELDELLVRLQRHIGHVTTLLERPDVGIFEALSVTLQTNYSEEIYEIRTLKSEFDGRSAEDLQSALDEAVVRLQQIDVARQYLKTLYMQDELAKISRYLLYTGTPAVLVAVVMMHLFAATTQPVLAPTTMAVLIPLALTVGVAPLGVLLAFVLRISTVAQRTVAITPFTTPTQEEDILSNGLDDREDMIHPTQSDESS